MKRNSTSTNEEKLKELTYQHAKMVGEELQRQFQTPLTESQVVKMDKALEEGLKRTQDVIRLRELIKNIDKDKVPDLPFVNASTNYKYAYYLYLLAQCTHNPNLIAWAEQMKEEVLKHEMKS